MKKNIYFKIVPILLLFILFITSNCYIFAKEVSNPIKPGIDNSITNSTGSITPVDVAVGIVWRTVVVILQVAAIGGIIFAGVRYMFASADAKADIKSQTLIIIVGAIFVFSTSILIDFIRSVIASALIG